jgi:hypothetical protein
MRLALAAVIIAALTVPAFAQDNHVPRYGEADKEKSQTEKDADKAAADAYKRSLGNIPDKGPSDPWGTMRNDAPKPATKTATTKTTKTKKSGTAEAKSQ